MRHHIHRGVANESEKLIPHLRRCRQDKRRRFIVFKVFSLAKYRNMCWKASCSKMLMGENAPTSSTATERFFQSLLVFLVYVSMMLMVSFCFIEPSPLSF